MNNTENKTAILYCRVSSTKSAQEGESLDSQDKNLRQLAQGKDLAIIPAGKVFRETYTGRKDIRPVLEEIFTFIKNNPGQVDYFVFRNIDRFTRGGSYSYDNIKRRLASYGVQMMDASGVIQPTQNTLDHLGFEYEWSRRSPSQIAETVIADTANAEITTILTRMIGREIELTNQGFKIREAADGFENKKVSFGGKKKVIQVPQPERAKFLVEIFNLRAAGTHTDKEIVERVNAMGYKTIRRHRWDKSHEKIIGSTGGVPLTVKRLQELIIRPIYCGVMCEKWTRYKPIKAQYDGLVSIETFNRANRGKVFIKENSIGLEILYDFHPERIITLKTRNNPLFPYKNLVLCDDCRKPFWGSCPKGRSGQAFPTYHCARKHKYIGIPKAKFDVAFEDFIRNIKLTPAAFDALEGNLLNRYHVRKNEILQSSINVHQTIADLKTEQKAKAEAFVAAINSPVLRAELERQIEELEVKIKAVNNESHKMDITEADINTFKDQGKYLLEHLPELLFKSSNPTQQASLFNLLFEGLPTYSEIVSGTAKMAQIFTISNDDPTKTNLVRSSGLSWNTIQTTILRWKATTCDIVLPKVWFGNN